MRGIRDGPGKSKVAVEAAFFVGKKAGVKKRKHKIEPVSKKRTDYRKFVTNCV